MLSDEVIEKVTERLVNRIEQANTYVLKEIGKSINKIGTLTPTKAQELAQILKYGGDYNKITKQLAKITNLNVSDIQKIFEEVAKSDYQFAKQFYDYRGINYIPYENNLTLKNQVDAISKLMVGNYINKTSAIGFSVKDLNGNVIFKDLANVYRDTIDKAVLSISQGKSTFDNEMYKTIKELASSGLKTLDYESGRSIRLDSAISMNIKDTLRQMHNETQEVIGEQFGYDGVEITVHENPAEDHEDAQGKQFSLEQYELLQTTGYATTYDNKKIDMHLELKSGESSISFRPISQYNCYHYTFAIILGVSVPAYSNEELEQIQERNNKGFDFDGKHYTMYEGTQLQRKLERKIREQKDIQIMAKESGQMDLVDSSQRNITALTRKYKELSEASGLPTKMDRMRVSGYKRTAIKQPTKIDYDFKIINNENNETLYNKMLNNAENVKNNMPNEQLTAMKHYAGRGFKEINETLVYGEPKSGYELYNNVNEINYDIEQMDEIMKNNTIGENIIAYKGTLNENLENYNIGDEFELPIYYSTSLKESVAERFATNYGLMANKTKAILEIRVPKETKGIYLADLYRDTNEWELLLNRNVKYKVISSKEIDPSGLVDGVYVHKPKYVKYILEVVNDNRR